MECPLSTKKKYFNNDEVFKTINKEFLSLKEDDKKKINVHLHQVINTIIQKMKNDYFFKNVYQRISFSGSYYKRTKIGSPEEFDINIVIKLPINYKYLQVEQCNYPGFVKIYYELNSSMFTSDEQLNRSLSKLFDDDMYLDQCKFRNWIESVLFSNIKTLRRQQNKYLLNIQDTEYFIKIIKSGPAFTLTIESSFIETISIDLVPVLELSQAIPNMNILKYDKFQIKYWFAVPKPLGYSENNYETNICWRTSFYELEKKILNKYGKIKQAIRFMKKLRDTQNWKNIASYYIETIALYEVKFNTNLETKSSTFLFMEMLKRLHMSLKCKRLTYYWDYDLNLLDKCNPDEIINFEKRLERIIKNINDSIDTNPYIIAYYMLNDHELNILKLKMENNSEEIEEPKERSNRCTIL